MYRRASQHNSIYQQAIHASAATSTCASPTTASARIQRPPCDHIVYPTNHLLAMTHSQSASQHHGKIISCRHFDVTTTESIADTVFLCHMRSNFDRHMHAVCTASALAAIFFSRKCCVSQAPTATKMSSEIGDVLPPAQHHVYIKMNANDGGVMRLGAAPWQNYTNNCIFVTGLLVILTTMRAQYLHRKPPRVSRLPGTRHSGTNSALHTVFNRRVCELMGTNAKVDVSDQAQMREVA